MTVTTSARTSRSRAMRIGVPVLIAILVVGVFASACVGTLDIPVSTTWDAVFSFNPADSNHLLVRHQRIPRALLSAVVGFGIGVAGAVMQALTRNPLAEPGLLGVNAGAAVAIAVGISFFGITTVGGYMWLGAIGAAIAGSLVYALGGVRRGTNAVRLVLAGAALTVVLTALTHFVLVNSPDEVYDRFRHWMVGSLAGRGFDAVYAAGALILIGVLLAFSLARALDSAMLGEDLSRSLGGSPAKIWGLAGLAVILLAGAGTAAAGPIVFVGLAAPHLARLVVGANHLRVLPLSGLIAAVLMVVADTLGRVIPEQGEIGVGIMASLIGGPFFIYLVRRRRMAEL
ncbi:MAG: FecCD family ABC transporter permease [Cumulibacter sp.]